MYENQTEFINSKQRSASKFYYFLLLPLAILPGVFHAFGLLSENTALLFFSGSLGVLFLSDVVLAFRFEEVADVRIIPKLKYPILFYLRTILLLLGATACFTYFVVEFT